MLTSAVTDTVLENGFSLQDDVLDKSSTVIGDENFISIHRIARDLFFCGDTRAYEAVNAAGIQFKTINTIKHVASADLYKLEPFLGVPYEKRVTLDAVRNTLKCSPKRVLKLAEELQIQLLRFRSVIEFRAADAARLIAEQQKYVESLHPTPRSFLPNELKITNPRFESILNDLSIKLLEHKNGLFLSKEDHQRIVNELHPDNEEPSITFADDSVDDPDAQTLPETPEIQDEDWSLSNELLEELNESLSSELKLHKKLIKSLKKENKFFRQLLQHISKPVKKQKLSLVAPNTSVELHDAMPEFDLMFRNAGVSEVEDILLKEFDKCLNYKLHTNPTGLFAKAWSELLERIESFFEGLEGDLGPIDKMLEKIFTHEDFATEMQSFYLPTKDSYQSRFDCLTACLGELYSKDHFQLTSNPKTTDRLPWDCVHLKRSN